MIDWRTKDLGIGIRRRSNGAEAEARAPKSERGRAVDIAECSSDRVSTARSTVQRSRNRTSAFAGWTFTSTASAGSVTSRKNDGLTPATMVDRYAASTARAIPASRTARPLIERNPRRVDVPTSAGRCDETTGMNRAGNVVDVEKIFRVSPTPDRAEAGPDAGHRRECERVLTVV